MTWIFALPHSPPNEVVHRGGKEKDQDILPTTLVVEEKREESDVDNAKRRRLPKEHIDRQEKERTEEEESRGEDHRTLAVKAQYIGESPPIDCIEEGHSS